MQGAINMAMPRTPVQISIINQIGSEAGTESLLMGRTLPYVQDNEMVGVARRWGAMTRELWILDAMNRRVEVIDLTVRSLSEPMNELAVRNRILEIARR
jgi:hypothetical protein